MRSLRGIAARWPISVLCIVAMVAPIIMAMIPARAVAQVATTRVAVVDFRNSSKNPELMFAKMGTDAVVLELLRSGRFDITTSDTLRSTMEKIGYASSDDRTSKVLLTEGMMRNLGKELGVESVLDGEILSMDIDKKKKTAKVRLVIRMLDITSGEWINGAVATGNSHPRIGYTSAKDTDWIVEAVNDAAQKCVTTMTSFNLPECYVIGNYGPTEILLNKGSSDGIIEGMDMLVTRLGDSGDDEYVGKIRIVEVGKTDARGAVTTSVKGVKPQDKARAVYEVQKDVRGSDTPNKPIIETKHAKKKNGLLWAVVGLALLWGVLGDSGSDTETTPGVVAMASSTDDYPSAFSLEEVGIILAWDQPKPLLRSNIIEYHIWRDDVGVEGDAGGPVLVGDMFRSFAFSGPMGSWDHSAFDTTAIRIDITYQRPGRGTNDALEAITFGTEDDPVPGISVNGRSHSYYITTVYRRPSSGGSEDAVETFWETSPVLAGRATAVIRPSLTAPGGTGSSDPVDLTSVTFEWEGSLGANEYVIEVSPDPNFARSSTWVSGPIAKVVSSTGQALRETFSGSRSLALSSELRSLPVGTMLYWRVGARNRLDKPGPYCAGPSPQKDGAKHTRYIYTSPSLFFTFTVDDRDVNPPPPPGGDGGTGGGDTPPPPPG